MAGTGADGFAFVIQNENSDALGGGGGGIGYAGLNQFVAIEFDTWDNGAGVGEDDPNGNHIDVRLRGVNAFASANGFGSSLGRSSQIPDLSDGSEHNVVIRYDGSRLEVFIDNLNTPAVSTLVDLRTALGLASGRAYVGLTSASGTAAAQKLEVSNWEFTPRVPLAVENDLFEDAQKVGNLLAADRNTISIGGELSTANDIDWFTFDLDIQQIQSIAGVNGGAKTWSTVFDIDYADGIRGDLTLSIFDSRGALIYIGRDSNVADDQPGAGQGNDFDDLSRGSAGKLDAFIGPVQMPATAGRYYVAISSNGQLPEVLDATFKSGATDALVRLEPVNSVTRIAEDHIGFTGYRSGKEQPVTTRQPEMGATPLIDIANLSAHATPFTLSDVTLFVYTARTVETVDALRGGRETLLMQKFAGEADNALGDIAMRSDGKLFQYASSGNAGVLNTLNTVNGAATLVGDDNIPLAPANPPLIPQIAALTDTIPNRTSFPLPAANIEVGSLEGELNVAFTDPVSGTVRRGSWNFVQATNGTFTFTPISVDGNSPDVDLANTAIVKTAQPGAPFGVLAVAWTSKYTPVPDTAANLLNVEYRIDDPNAITTDTVDALAFRRMATTAPTYQLYYSVREGGKTGTQSRLYRGDATSGNAATSRIGTDVIGGGSVGVVTGMAFVGSTMYGVDDQGQFFLFVNVPEGQDVRPSTDVVVLSTVAGQQFQGLALGPQNLQNGFFSDKLFAITDSGRLYCFDTDGNLQPVFDRDGDGVATDDWVNTGASGTLGLAFSPLDVNLWHPTMRRADEAGHGVGLTPDATEPNKYNDNTRTGEYDRTYSGFNGFDWEFDSETAGGMSMYFGLEEYVRRVRSEYYTGAGGGGQAGADATWHADLTSNTEIGGNYNLPGGAYGSLITNSFDLSSYDYTDKPTVYFNYWLQTENASSVYDQDDMRDSARVFVSVGNGAWQLLATNNSERSEIYTDKGELPNFLSASERISYLSNQRVQELFDTGSWRQARIDLGRFAGVAGSNNVRLRFDFTTAGEFDANQRSAVNTRVTQAVTNGTQVTVAASTAIVPGMAVVANGVAGATVVAVNQNTRTVTLSTPVTLLPNDAIAFGTSVVTTVDNDVFYETQVTVASSTGIVPGMAVIATGINDGVTVLSVDQTNLTVTLSTAVKLDAGDTITFRLLLNNIPGYANETGAFSVATAIDEMTPRDRGANNQFEGFYIDDIIVGLAERGEMVTSAPASETGFFDVNTPLPSADKVPAQFLQGPYQLEIRRGAEYGANENASKADVKISQTFDTNERLIRSLGGLGDENLPREQGQFIIEGNWIANAKTYGISIDAGERDPETGAPASGAPRKFSVLNNSRLAPGAVVVNNVISSSGTAGILFSGDPNVGNGPLAAVPYGRIVNNTIYGGATQAGVGIQVTENAAPTLLNNVFSGLTTAIDVDSTSVNDGLGNLRTVIGTSAFHNVGTQVNGTSANQSLTLATNPFVAAQFANFYLAEGSQAIDSALNTLQDRAEYTVVTSQLGISVSPIVAPSRDIYGQLRGDDPKQASMPGLGSDIFKDRGAVDRVDFAAPFRTLVIPADTVRAVAVVRDDLENALTASGAAGRGITRLELQLADRGVGIDPATVRPEAFTLLRGTTALVLGRDYLYSFDPTKNVVTLEAVTVFAPDSYTLTANSQKAVGAQAGLLTDLANNTLRPNNDDGTLTFAITLQDVPDSPADLTAVSGNTQVSLSWTASAANGSPIVSYVIEYSTTGIDPWTPFTRPVGEAPTATSTTVTGLTNGQGYWFRVAANNALSQGPWSDVAGPVTPLKVPTLTLAADTGSSPSDGITNNGQVNVGNLDTGTTWQYRTNGGAWLDGTGAFFALTPGVYPSGSIQVRQSVAGSVSGLGSNATAITVDQLAAAPTPTLAVDTGSSPSDGITSNGLVNVAGIEPGATWQFSTNNGSSWSEGTGASFTLPAGTYPANTIRVKQTDVAGNNSPEASIATAITVDTTTPAAPSLALAVDTGASPSDGVTSNGRVNVTGIVTNATWEFSTNSGTSWTAGSNGFFTLPVGTYAAGRVQVRQTSLAGNPSGAASNATAITVDQLAAAPTPTLAVDTGSSPSDGITSNGLVNVAGIEPGATWQFSTNNGSSWSEGTGASFTLPAGTYPANTIRVKQTDVAGNNSPEASIATAITVDTAAPGTLSLALAVDTGTNPSDGVTSNGLVTVAGFEAGATWQYSTNNGGLWTAGTGSSFTLPAGTYPAGTIRVRQTDVAGNSSVEASIGTAITVDSTAPAAPLLALAADTGTSPFDGVTSNGLVNVTGIAPNATWEFSTNGGATWSVGVNGFFTLPVGTYAANSIQVRQTSLAGLPSVSRSMPSAVTVDQAAVAPTPTLAIDTGASPSDGITTNGLVNVAGIEPGATWQYSTNNGSSWTTGSGSSFTLPAGTYPAGAIRVRQTDLAGNNSGEGLAPQVVVDVAGPAIVGFSTNAAAGTYGPGTPVTIIATTNEAVQAGSAISVTLNTGAVITLRADVAGTILSGIYQIAVGDNASQLAIVASGAGSVADVAGNPLTSIVSLPNPVPLGIAVDGAIRLVTPVGFSSNAALIPDRRVTVTSIPITFNTPVTGLSLASFKLMLNGRSVSLRGARLTGSGTNYTLTLPSRLTNTRGIYTLQIVAANIKATTNGAAMAENQTIYWGKGRSVGFTVARVTAARAPAPRIRTVRR